MNLNDYRLNAYRTAAEKKPEHNGKPAAGTPVKNIDKGNDQYTDTSVKAAAAALTSGGLLKIQKSTQGNNGQDTIYRRVAKFLLLIGVDEAAKILPHLSEAQTEKIIPEIASIRHVDRDEAASILAEFQALVQKSREAGGVDTAKTILEKAFGEKKAEEMLQKAVPFAEGKPFEYLNETDTDKIIFLLKDESVAVRALVLSYLKPKTAASVINAFSPEDKTRVIMRLAKMEPVLPEVLHRVDQSMHEKSMAVNTEKAIATDGRGILAQILKRMTPQAEQNILATLSDTDPELGHDLKQRLFTTEDFINSDDRFIQEQLGKMDNTLIAALIADKSDDFRSKILRNVSKTRGDVILEEEQLKKPIPGKDIDKVTSQFFNIMRQAFDDGKLVVKNRSDDIFV